MGLRNPPCAIAILLVLPTAASAYQVWTGTHNLSTQLLTQSTDWARTAAWIEGINVNTAPHDTFPTTRTDFRNIFRRIDHVESTTVGMHRAEVTRDRPSQTDDQGNFVRPDEQTVRQEIRTHLDRRLSVVNGNGARMDELMLYDERVDGVLFTWSEDEIRYMREELDAMGRSDVDLIWRATNNAIRNSRFAELELIDGLLIEGSATRFVENRFNVNTLAASFWNNPLNAGKNLYLQMPRTESDFTQYEETRRAVLEMQNVLGIDAVRSDRLVIMPVTYVEDYPYLNETANNGATYTDSLLSTALSLIEQRPYFEGRLGELPAGFAESLERFQAPASLASVADGSLRQNKNNSVVDGAGIGSVINSTRLEIGESSGTPRDQAAVIPFQLPLLGNVDDPFLAAHFEGFLTETATEDGATADLYGLDRRSTPDILNSDYFGQTDAADPNATLLQDDFLRDDLDVNAPVYSNAGGNQNLIDFLNEQYAGGEGAGEYVFLRINTDEDTDQTWEIASGNDGDEPRRPQLRFTPALFEGLEGDYDDDGTVSAGDYATWRGFAGGPGGVLRNDPLGGRVGTPQYDVWGENFTGQAAGASAAAVPEPTGLALLLTVGAVAGLAGMRAV